MGYYWNRFLKNDGEKEAGKREQNGEIKLKSNVNNLQVDVEEQRRLRRVEECQRASRWVGVGRWG